MKGKRQLKTPWIVEITKDKRYIWRGDSKLDQQDIRTLLLFLLAKRLKKYIYTDYKTMSQYQISYECPTIVINAGSHGIGIGTNAFQNGNQQLLDQNIIDQSQYVIYKLIQQNKQLDKLLLTQQNAINKIHINDISLEKPNVYPIKADHIIDTQCRGAYSMIKAKQLTPQGKSHQQKDLLFLYQPNKIFLESLIIKDLNCQTKLINFFKTSNINIKKVYKYFSATDNNFKLENFWERCSNSTDLLVICITNKNKIIGAYSPIFHLWNGEGQIQYNQSEFVKDKTKTSFIFSLTENQRFELIKQSEAVCRIKDKKGIWFGVGEFRINDDSNTENCWALTNGQEAAYFNPSYKNYQDIQSCRRFNGNDNQYFTTKQWQVWKIEMEQRKK